MYALPLALLLVKAFSLNYLSGIEHQQHQKQLLLLHFSRRSKRLAVQFQLCQASSRVCLLRSLGLVTVASIAS